MVFFHSVIVVALVTFQDVGVNTFRHGKSLKKDLLNIATNCVISNYYNNFEPTRNRGGYDSQKMKLSPCFFACVFKKTKFMDAEGRIFPKRGMTYLRKYLDMADRESVKNIIDFCTPSREARTDCNRGITMAKCIFDSVRGSARVFTNATELKSEMVKNIKMCANKYGLTNLALLMAFVTNTIHTLEPCFLGCVLKSGGLINGTGHVQVEGALNRFRKLVNDQEYEVLSGVFQGSKIICFRVVHTLIICKEFETSALQIINNRRTFNNVNGTAENVCESGKILTPYLIKEFHLNYIPIDLIKNILDL